MIEQFLLFGAGLALLMSLVWLFLAFKKKGRYWLKPPSFFLMALVMFGYSNHWKLWILVPIFVLIVLILFTEASLKRTEES